MATMSDLHARADKLRSLGLTERRALGVLRKEFPQMERDQLLRAVTLPGSPKGVTPGWALGGAPLKPVVIRFQPKAPRVKHSKRRRKVVSTDAADPLRISIRAADMDVGDWVEPHGIVRNVAHVKDKMVVATFKNGVERGFHPQGHVSVRLEDTGEDD